MKDKTLDSLEFVLRVVLTLSFIFLATAIYNKDLALTLAHSLIEEIFKGKLDNFYMLAFLLVFLNKNISKSVEAILDLVLSLFVNLFFFLRLYKIFPLREFTEIEEEIELSRKFLRKEEIIQASNIKKIFYYNVLLIGGCCLVFNFSLLNTITYLVAFIFFLFLIFDENMKVNILNMGLREGV